MLKFTVDGQKLELLGDPFVVADTFDFLTGSFKFYSGHDWELTEKHVFFQLGTGTPYEVTLTDDEFVKTDHVNLTTGAWDIHVVGYDIDGATLVERITTNKVSLTAQVSGVQDGEPFPPSIIPDVLIVKDQTVPQTFINGVPKLAADREISDDHHLADKKYVDDHTPPTPVHNDLGSLQGGSSTERYHMTQAENTALHAHANKVALDAVSGTNTGDQAASSFNHNDLANKQGGTTNEYYHVTAAEKTVISNTSGTNTGDQDLSGYAELDDLHAHANKTALDLVSGTNTGDQIAIGVPYTPSAPLVATTVQGAIDELSVFAAKRYGVRFDGSASNGTRLFDAAGMSAAVGTGSTPAYNDFDSILPWSGMRRCNTALLNGERVPTYFEGEAGYSNTAADVYVYVPLFYYFRSDDDSRHVVSMTPLSGYRAPSKFIRGDGSLHNYVFLPAYTAGLVGAVPVSRSGYYPHITSLNGWMTLLAAKHTDATLANDVWIESMKDDEIKCILMEIEFATRDHQTVMTGATSMRYATDQVTAGGVNQFTVPTACASTLAVGQAIAIGTTDKGSDVTTNATILTINTTTGVVTFAPVSGNVTVSIGNYISSRPWKSGACDAVVASSGSPESNSSGVYPCKYRGIENPWGNQYRWRWDYLQSNNAPSILLDPTKYAAGAISADYDALSYTVPTSNGYATEMGFDPDYPFVRVTKAVGGSSTTYFADYFYQAAGVRALLVGGYVTYGRVAGSRSFSVDTSPSNAYWSIGAALSPA